MSSSIDVMKLSQEPTIRIERFGPNLVSVLLRLITEIANYCESKNFDLTGVSAFSDTNQEWTNSLLSIYQSLYTADCQKMSKIMKNKGIDIERRGIPDNVVCYSSAIRPFLQFLNDWRAKHHKNPSDLLIHQKLNQINEDVAGFVFGRKEAESLQQSSIKIQEEKASEQESTVKLPDLNQVESKQEDQKQQQIDQETDWKTSAQQQRSKFLPAPQLETINNSGRISIERPFHTLEETELKNITKKVNAEAKLAEHYLRKSWINRQNFISGDPLKSQINQRYSNPTTPTLKKYHDLVMKKIHDQRTTVKKSPQKLISTIEDQGLIQLLESIRKEHILREGGTLALSKRAYRNRNSDKKQFFTTTNANQPSVSLNQWSIQESIVDGDISKLSQQLVHFEHQIENEPKTPILLQNEVNQQSINEEIQQIENGNHSSLDNTVLDQNLIEIQSQIRNQNQSQIESINRSHSIIKEGMFRRFQTTMTTSIQGLTEIKSPSDSIFTTVGRVTHRQELSKGLQKNLTFSQPSTQSTKIQQFQLQDYTSGLQFNTLGILNTQKESCIYRVNAQIGPHSFAFDQIDWLHTTHRNFRLKNTDFILMKQQYELEPNCCIVFKVSKYNYETKEVDLDYAFAVQPLARSFVDKLQLICGQFQLPLFQGAPPMQIFENKENPLQLIIRLQASGQCCNLEFVQMVSRVSTLNAVETYTKNWWPLVDTSMVFVKHRDKTQIYRYVLHARHGHDDSTRETIKSKLGQHFEDSLQEAELFFNPQQSKELGEVL